MKNKAYAFLVLLCLSAAFADTPPPGIVGIRVGPVPVSSASPFPVYIPGGLPVSFPSGAPLPVVVASPVVVSNFPSPTPTQSVYVVNPAPLPSPTITVVVAGPSPLPVSGTVTISNPAPTPSPTITVVVAGPSPLPVSIPTPLPVSQSGTWNIGNITGTVSLPTGASTASNQSSQITQETATASNTTSMLANQTNGTQKTQVTSIPSDLTPATQTVTIVDSASVTTAYANGQNFITGTPTTGSAASFTISSITNLEVQVTGSWSGTIQTEVSMDGGTTWFTHGIKQTGSSYNGSSYTQNFEGGANLAGMTNFRVRAVSAIVGSLTVKAVFSVNPTSIIVSNPITLRDSTIQSNTIAIKGSTTAASTTDNSIVVGISPNSNTVTQGTPAPVASPWPVAVVSGGNIATYTACYNDLTVPAAPTDIFYITGSATKTVTVLRIDLSGTRSTVLMTEWDYIIRSSPDTGGTCTAMTTAPRDSNNPAYTASVAGCTTSPTTLGTAVGFVFNRKFVIPATTGVDSDWPQTVTFGGSGQGQGVVLRGTSQILAINPSNTAITGGIINVCIDWTEQ